MDAARSGGAAEAAWNALRDIYIAEGSDYTWWVDSMPYYLAAPFEALFRKHLANAYRAAGLAPPQELGQPVITPEPGAARFQTDPLSGPIPMVQSSPDLPRQRDQ